MDVAVGAPAGPFSEPRAELAQGIEAALLRAAVKSRFQFRRAVLRRVQRGFVHRTITCPLSTTSVCPVMQRAASEHRKTIAAAMSERLISRFKAVSEV